MGREDVQTGRKAKPQTGDEGIRKPHRRQIDVRVTPQEGPHVVLGCQKRGDGVLQADTEECDDGNTVDTDACRYNCADASCGDGVVRGGVEACDDGNVVAGDGCSPACKVEGDDMEPEGMPDGGGCCQTSGGTRWRGV